MMSLCGLLSKLELHEPVLDDVPVHMSAGWNVPRPRAREVERRRVCTFVRTGLEEKDGNTDDSLGCTGAATGSKAKGHSDEC